MPRFESFGQSGQVKDVGQPGGKRRDRQEIPFEDPDPVEPLDPPEPGRIADESVDLIAGIFEETLDEMTSEEPGSSGDQDLHDPDCMRFGPGGQ